MSRSAHLNKEEEEDAVVKKGAQYDDVARSGPSLREATTLIEEDHRSMHRYSDRNPESVQNDREHGMKEDLPELGNNLSNQFWGMALSLAPPPPPQQRSIEQKLDAVERENEYSGLDQFGESINHSQMEDLTSIIEDAVGITEEVLTFARNIAHHPETWLDFPLSEEEEFDDYYVSDDQYKHLLAIEYLAPRLAALRIELCPAHMTECYFWMVYFVLLHSRLNTHDAKLLSSPQIVQARRMWIQELDKQTKDESLWTGSITSTETGDSIEDAHFDDMPNISINPIIVHSTAHHKTKTQVENEIDYVDKSIIKEDTPLQVQDKEMVTSQKPDDTDDDSDWFKEDCDLIEYNGTSIFQNEEDISFSDLEDDINFTMPIKSKMVSQLSCK